MLITQILGTTIVFPSGTSDTFLDAFGLQRVHPISLTDATTFPLGIEPTVNTNSFTQFEASSIAVWGFRLSDPLDTYHSD